MRVIGLVLAGLVVAGGGAPRLRAQQDWDSAGVRIVLNERPLLSSDRGWRVAPSPVFTVGAGDLRAAAGDTLYEFTLISGIARLSDGRIAVGVQGSHQLRFFDARGRFSGTAGRRGQGPGEFQQIMGVRVTRGDTLAITDLAEVEWYSGAGRFIRPGYRVGAEGSGAFIWPSGFFPDGSHIGFYMNDPAIPSAGRQLLRRAVVRVSEHGARSDTLARLPFAEMTFNGRQRFGRPLAFLSAGQLAADGDVWYHGYPSEYRIDAYDLSGRMVRSARRAAAAVRVTETHREAVRQHLRSAPGEDGRPVPPEMAARRDQFISQMEFAEHFPFFGTLLPDRQHNLWVQRYDFRAELRRSGPVSVHTIDVPTLWDVFDGTGRWITTVELPARFTPQDIGDDYVVGVVRNADDDEGVRMLRLIKP